MAEFIELPGRNKRLKRHGGRIGGEYPGDDSDFKLRKHYVGTQTGKRSGQTLRKALADFQPGEEETEDDVLGLDTFQSRWRQHAENYRD